jgi:hypothetical protein
MANLTKDEEQTIQPQTPNFTDRIRAGLEQDKSLYQNIGQVLQAPKNVGAKIGEALVSGAKSVQFPQFSAADVQNIANRGTGFPRYPDSSSENIGPLAGQRTLENPTNTPGRTIPETVSMLPKDSAVKSPWAQKFMQDADALKQRIGSPAASYQFEPPAGQQIQQPPRPGASGFKHNENNIYTNVPTGRPNEVRFSEDTGMRTPGEKLEERIRGMLPGANNDQVKNIMFKVAQQRLLSEASRKTTPEKPTYQTVNPGQTLLQMTPGGQAKEVYRSPSAQGETKAWDKNVDQAQQAHKTSRDAYNKGWDAISENVPNEPNQDQSLHYITQREKAHHDYNTQYFTSLGVEPGLAAVHESRELFLRQMLKPGERMSSEQKQELLKDHKLLMKERHRQMSKKYNNTLRFDSGN